MSMESAREAQGKGRAGSPTGFRRYTVAGMRCPTSPLLILLAAVAF
jgi:hypothetical protein